MCTMYIKIVPGDTGPSEGYPRRVQPPPIQYGIINSVGNVTNFGTWTNTILSMTK